MKVSIVLAILLFFISCNDEDNEQSQTESETSQSGCYQFASNTDTINMQIQHNGDPVTGTLVYNFKEKDINTGTITGTMKGDMLVADYKFMSEGVESYRQVAFKKQGDSFV